MTRGIVDGSKMTEFSKWIRSNCRDSKTGLSLSNIDYVITDYKKKTIMILEEKTRLGEVHFAQQRIMEILDKALRLLPDWDYKGLHIVKFSNEGPEDSFLIELDGLEVTKEGLKDFINNI